MNRLLVVLFGFCFAQPTVFAFDTLPKEKGALQAESESYRPHRVNLSVKKLNKNTLVVLSALQVLETPEGPFRRDWLTIKKRSRNGWKTIARKRYADQEEEGACFTGNLIVNDFDNDHIPEIAVKRTYMSDSGGTPEDIRVYRFSRSKLIKLGEFQSNQEIVIRESTMTHKTLILNSYEIGWEMCHGEMPRWNNIYEVRGNRLRQANAESPWFFKKWVKRLRALVRKYPDDKDIWAHLGYAASYAKVKTNPRKEYNSVLHHWKNRLGRAPKDPSKLLYWEDVNNGLKKLRNWVKSGKPFPKAIHPLFLGDYMKDNQSPRDMPPKGCR